MSTKPEDSEALFNTSFNTFFEAATGHNPFPYQARLAREPWPVLIDVPTGLGKTAAVLMAWLWKRLAGDADTGRRLVYCLPMRSLVEQTAEVARAMCTALGPRFAEADRRMPAVAVLMGGAASGDWEREPARDQILVGTQDMLLSRALNRGYAMSRFRWPVAFGLLNSDCMWVFDETQLMGVGVETSAQLQAFRDTLGTVGPTRSVWMSATLGQGQLCTVDHRAPADGWTSLTLGDADRDIAAARRRLDAPKQLAPAAHTLGAKNETAYCEAVAARAVEHCQTRGGLTLVVVNRVSRAQAIYRAARAANGELAMALIHSRFRPVDRRAHEAVLFGQGNESPAEDRLVIATQAIEAGVDVSARTLMTELAPWSSLVQRMGRCNRYGTEDDAVVEWLDIETGAKLDGLALPYDMAELDDARHKLGAITDAGPAALSAVEHEARPRVRPILRRRDLLQLFDTTPDLAGADTDVSRFVRDGADTDVQFFWRAATSDNASDNEIDNSANSTPSRDELCRVSLGGAADFLTRLSKKRASAANKKTKTGKKAKANVRLDAHRWDISAGEWIRVRTAFPGQVIRLSSGASGYDQALGWTGDIAGPVAAAVAAEDNLEAMADDPDSLQGRWVALPAHLGHVRSEARDLGEQLAPAWQGVLETSGLWHDVGKAHPAFQHKLTAPVAGNAELAAPGPGPWAKSGHKKRAMGGRAYFRHELASALAWLQQSDADTPQRSLIAYLVAAHHGKVRMSIRSLPEESPPPGGGDTLFARGVWHGDELPALTLPTGRDLPACSLSLEPMLLGAGSWTDNAVGLRDAPDLGPFRLALLESLVRIADWIASAKEQAEGYGDE